MCVYMCVHMCVYVCVCVRALCVCVRACVRAYMYVCGHHIFKDTKMFFERKQPHDGMDRTLKKQSNKMGMTPQYFHTVLGCIKAWVQLFCALPKLPLGWVLSLLEQEANCICVNNAGPWIAIMHLAIMVLRNWLSLVFTTMRSLFLTSL